MTSFVLPRHANAEMLHKMLRCFRDRLDKECVGEGTATRYGPVTRELLQSMVNTLDVAAVAAATTQQYMLYWPMANKTAYNTKLCLYKEPGPHNIHLVSVPVLIDKLHPTKNHFSRCVCTHHASRIRFDWREFIYPQFVDLLFRRIQLPSNCPSPSTNNAHCIINEKLQFSMEIDKTATFLPHVADDLFRLSCSELCSRYKNRHLSVFGRENVEGLCHFNERRVTEDNYKLTFKLSATKVRATEIVGGGHLTLKPTNSVGEPYVVVASNFYLVPGTLDTPHYKVYVLAPGTSHHGLAHHTNKRFKSTKLCGDDGQLCMIVSSSPLTLVFREGWRGSFVLATPAYCNIVMRDCRLALWTKDHRDAWPLKYEIVGRGMLKSEYVGHLGTYYAKIHGRYDALFNHAPFSTVKMEAPAHGYVLTREEESVVGCTADGAPICARVPIHELIPHNQYGTVLEYDNGGIDIKSAASLRRLRVYFRQGSEAEPSFWDEDDQPMTVMRESYRPHGSSGGTYTLSALFRKGAPSPWCYFYVNRERTYLLFIAFE